MDNNFKLRKAIIVAIALIGTGYSLHSKALGLGDIQVKSYLGQPLLASIQVHGVDNKMDESCFSVTSDDINAIRDVKFKLKHLSGDQGLLTVSSSHAVLEPIASLTVVSQCDSPFTRQYSLLIDPSITQNASNTSLYVESSSVADSTLSQDALSSQAADENGAAYTQKSTAKRKAKRVKKSTTSNLANTADAFAQTTAYAQTINKKPEPVLPVPAAPKLTISGGDLSTSINPYSLQLNFDKKINTNREINPQAYAAEAEFADEVTVMNNRLAHLEKQLTGLYSKNANLEKLNKDNVAALSEVKHQNDFLRTLSFCLGGGLLGSGYFFVDWLRRRKAEKAETKTQAIWDSTEELSAQDEPVQEFKIDENYVPVASEESFEVTAHEDLTEFHETNIYQSPFIVNEAPTLEENTSDVIEDADVFISHGRTTLAVQLLQHHLMEAPKKSASTWLFLLDLLAKEGLQKEFDIAANECKKHFNVQLADFSAPVENANTLESFERITSELQKIWGTEEAVVFLDELIYNTRMEPRMGFGKAVFEELVLLREIAQEEIKASEEIIYGGNVSSINEPKEKAMKLNLPEIEVSNEFKHLSEELTLVVDNGSKLDADESEHFEFELLDIAHR